MRYLLSLLVIFCSVGLVWGQGRIVFPEPLPQIEAGQVLLQNVQVNVDLHEGAGNVQIEQVFKNSAARALEAEFIFPLPAGSQLYDLSLYINGKKTKGRIYDKGEAWSIYSKIVRSMRDPALLEYSDNSLFKTRVFPIPAKGTRKIELSYASTLSRDNKAYKFVLPIKQSGQATIENYLIQINLEQTQKIADIYSPSHNIRIKRISPYKAQIVFEAAQLEAAKDFILYYTLSGNDVNASLLGFRPRTDRDGFFMFFASPDYFRSSRDHIAQDMIFVLDVSGSMGGEKISQAKKALNFCINTLHKEDRFEIISFSSSLSSFQNRLEYATSETRKNALYFVNNMEASGGTNIDEALRRALRLKSENERPTSIVFITDGLPTSGETDIGKILQNVKSEQKKFIRIFAFGVGYDVNTFLLDNLSYRSHGDVAYIKPGEEIESTVSSLFTKISKPALVSPNIDFSNLDAYDVYPRKLPDLFEGQRIMVFGRYRQAASEKIIELSGKSENSRKKFRYAVTLPERDTDNYFVEKLWANRKVNDLLTTLRLDGENDELIQSIRNLGLKYGIVTPYTSYLVTEQEQALEDFALGEGGVAGARIKEAQRSRTFKGEQDEESVGSKVYFDALISKQAPAAASSGRGAVMSSRVLKRSAAKEQAGNMLLTYKRTSDKSFYYKGGKWVENGLKSDDKISKKIKFLSDAYFDLLKERPQIRAILAIGDKVMFRFEGKIYLVY